MEDTAPVVLQCQEDEISIKFWARLMPHKYFFVTPKEVNLTEVIEVI